ncbi:MAG: AraC family transcriptional regulator [Sphingomonadales bacterium]|nr:AraC family transcriptional regulator [Sphingomonadales bacterium]
MSTNSIADELLERGGESLDQANAFLRNVRFGSELLYFGQLCDAWHLNTSGAGHASFHLIVHGKAWLHSPVLKEPTQMEAGDVIIFPHDAPHKITSKREDAPDFDDPTAMTTSLPYDENGEGTGLLCGYFKLDNHAKKLLLNGMPDYVLTGPRHGPFGKQIKNLTQMLMDETQTSDPGVGAVLARLADTLFFYAVRDVMHNNPVMSGVFAALSDPQLSPATTEFMENVAEQWSVDRLAKAAGMSRSTYADVFAKKVGLGPMEFVTLWRMELALQLFELENLSVSEAGYRVGYEAESAFRKAFKRIFGVGPGQFRKRV